MADPLSVAASVVGLLTAAAQISQTLYTVTKRVKRAPKECKDARTEVDDIRNILTQLQLFVMGATKASTSRTSLILVEQVVATLAATVTTFSELDVFVETLDSDEQMGLMDRLRWVTKEKDLRELVQRLQLHKNSMGLMLTILTCQSTIDAEDKVDRLCELVEQTLKQNVMLGERLSSFQTGTTVAITVEQKPAGREQLENADTDSDLAVQEAPRKFVFEELLLKSRVYRNMALDGNDTFSVLSSAGRTGSWSMLSGLSLSQMSNIAILALPIYASDLSNKEIYDFETITEDPVISVELPAQSSPREPPASRRRILSSLRKRFGGDPRDQVPISHLDGVFGVDIAKSIIYSNVAINLHNEQGESYVYGYIPIAVGKTGVFLKEKATDVELIFATAGHAARVNALQKAFDAADRYGKGLDWTGFTVHDCAAILLRYLKCLPQPVIPYACYQQFTKAFRQRAPALQGCSGDGTEVFDRTAHKPLVNDFRVQIVALPPLHRSLLLYLLELMAIFASKSDLNKMEIPRLVSVFHPAILSQRPQEMDEIEHKLAQDVVIFLVENQDDFLIGMSATKDSPERTGHSSPVELGVIKAGRPRASSNP